MSAAVDRVHAALEAAGSTIRERPDGFMAQCPAHEDDTPSLRVSTGSDGRALLRCHGGCDAKDVVAALGLTFADLFDGPPPTRDNGKYAPMETRYEVKTLAGELVATKIRRDYVEGRKDAVWVQPDGKMGLNGTAAIDLPMFGSEMLAASPDAPVIVTEGEKCALSLMERGYLALGTVTGASSAPSPKVLREALAGRLVYLWPDNDPPGQKHMQTIGKRLRLIARETRVIYWREAPPAGDAADFEGDHDDIDALLKSSGRFGDPPPPAPDPIGWVDISDLSQPIIPPVWLWKNVIAKKRVTLLAGEAKAGKTWMLTAWLAAITNGRSWLGMDPIDREIRVGYISEEGQDDVFARCKRFGARIMDLAPRGSIPTGMPWPEVVALTVRRAKDRGLELLVYDTLSYLAGIEDENDAHQVNVALRPLTDAAERDGLAIVPIHHFGRGGNIRGSTVFEANPDNLLRFKHHGPPDSRQRIMECKGRFSPMSPVIIEYQPAPPGGFDGYSLLGTATDAQSQEVEKDVVKVLRREMTWLPTTLVTSESGRRKQTVLACLQAMYDANPRRVQRVGIGSPQKPFVWAHLDVSSVPTIPEPTTKK